MKATSQSSHKPPSHFIFVFASQLPGFPSGPRVCHTLALLQPFVHAALLSAICLLPLLPGKFLLILSYPAQMPGSSLKSLLEPSLLNQVVVNFVVSSNSKHTWHSLFKYFIIFSLYADPKSPSLRSWYHPPNETIGLLFIQNTFIKCLLCAK